MLINSFFQRLRRILLVVDAPISCPGRLLLGVVIVTLAIGLATSKASAQAMYRIKPLGYLSGCTATVPVAMGFNKAGQVTGQACNATGDLHAFVWKNDGKPMVDLGPAEVGSTSVGNAINATGLVAGTAWDSTGQFGFVSPGNGTPMTKISETNFAYDVNDSGQVTGQSGRNAFLWKGDGTPMIVLDDVDDELGPYFWGTAINASGQIAGSSYDGDRGGSAFIWKNDGSPVLDLGRSYARACCINASGQVAVNSGVGGRAHPHAFLWRNDGSPMLDLGTFAQTSSALSGANALNDSGQVAGWAWTKWYGRQHAFVWINDGTPIKDLGTFGGTTSESKDINASGQVTGWASLTGDSVTHAFIWRNDGIKKQDLNALIDPADPLKSHVILTEGIFINDSGNILAQGTDNRTGEGLYLLQGTVLTLAPRSLAFGNQKVNTSSPTQSITVTNTGTAAVSITSVALAGPGAGQFAFTNGCGKSLASKAKCIVKVAFKPTTKGAKSAFLNVNGGGGGLRSTSLTGTGI